jgi:serine/arginine repetitive matrix protein 2
MYNGIGLASVRGSGTNGYVQKNMAHVSRQRTARAKSVDAAPGASSFGSKNSADPRRANDDILEHNRKRQVEVKVLQLREMLEEKGVDEEEIERKTDALRTSLLAKLPPQGVASSAAAGRAGETHSDAAAKAKETAALKSALGISSDYVGGSAFDQELQQRRKEERIAQRQAEEQQRLEAEAELERERAREEKRKRKEARREEKEERRRQRRKEREERRDRSRSPSRSGDD